MRIQTIFCAMMLAVSAAPAVCVAQEFSADVVYLSGSKSRPSANSDESGHSSKLYVSKEKMRLEPRGYAGTVLVLDRAQDTAFAIVPKTKEYEPLTGGVPEYFSVKDAENACPDWQSAGSESIDCEKAGHETIGGRAIVPQEGVINDVAWEQHPVVFVEQCDARRRMPGQARAHAQRHHRHAIDVHPDVAVTGPRAGVDRARRDRQAEHR